MRISGNYIERYFFTLFPWILVAGICGFFSTSNISTVVIAMVLLSILLILIDTILLRKLKLSKVSLLENKLRVNSEVVEESEISVIRPYKTSPPHSCLIIEFYLNDGACLKFMDKPKTFLYKAKNQIDSKSLDIVFEYFPVLKTKIRAQHS